MDFGAFGLWSYNGSSWSLLTTTNPEDMEGWATSLAADLGASGLWNYDGSAWSLLTTLDSEDMIDVDLYQRLIIRNRSRFLAEFPEGRVFHQPCLFIKNPTDCMGCDICYLESLP